MAGHDAKDATSLQQDQEDYTRYLGLPLQETTPHKPLAGLRIGLPKEYFAEGLSTEVRAAVETAIKVFEELGATCIEVTLPHTHLCVPVYYVIAPAEASSNLARFDGVRYGYRAEHYDNLQDMYQKSRAEGFGTEVKRRILIGSYVLSQGYYDAYYVQAQKIRRLITQDFQNAFQNCDVILGPTAPTVAWNIGEKQTDPLQAYLGDIYTIGTNLSGLPGISLPCGFSTQQDKQKPRPIGLQLIGKYFDEARLLQIADAFQRLTDWHTQQPELAN